VSLETPAARAESRPITVTVRDLLLRHAEDDGIALKHEDDVWSWRDYIDASIARAAVVRRLLDSDRPPHVGTLLGNTAEMAMALAAGALGNHVVVGLNTTRRGEALARDVRHADCQVVLTEHQHRPLLDGLDLGVAQVIEVDGTEWSDLVSAGRACRDHSRAAAPNDLFMLIFTSGTSGEPKAVTVTHEKVTGAGLMLAERFGLGPDDTCYVSMPLFHSNAVLAGWGVALSAGATTAVAPFSASGFLPDVRRFGATYLNYVGKPLAYVLATTEQPDDADNPLRIAFGNEAGDRDIAEFARRFGCTVVDGFGSTENAVVVSRVPGTPAGSLGQPLEGVAVLDAETSEECPRAVFDEQGGLTNADEAVGELVNTTGAGQFTGYYNDPAADEQRMRDGMYWSGDLAYRDTDGFVYFAGRTSEWLRVDGENLAAAPIERVLLRHPDLSRVAVYAVPDEPAGDQVAAALVLRDGATFDPDAFEEFLTGQGDLGPKMWPRHVRVSAELPTTATNKVLKRELTTQGSTGHGDPRWERDPRGTSYTRATDPHGNGG
jgi:fatty-acyl-CoA synthase